jgi:hypothetical protein
LRHARGCSLTAIPLAEAEEGVEGQAGIHGDWGAGKTSFLHQLQLYLTGECPQQSREAVDQIQGAGQPVGHHAAHVTVVWFEAWRYQQEQAPIVALLQEIRTQLPWYSKALSETRKLGEVREDRFMVFRVLPLSSAAPWRP